MASIVEKISGLPREPIHSSILGIEHEFLFVKGLGALLTRPKSILPSCFSARTISTVHSVCAGCIYVWAIIFSFLSI